MKNDFFTVLPDEEVDEDFLEFIDSKNSLLNKDRVYIDNLLKSLESVKGYDDELDIEINKIIENIHKIDKNQLVNYLVNLDIEREDIHVILFSSDDDKMKLNINKLIKFTEDLKKMIGV